MMQILRDPIHGSIELDGALVKIIDTPQFQRLRRIKQLGGASLVYPGAVHTRFEHSIGVCYIAGELVKGLNKHVSDSDDPGYISPEDSLCVQIAALCHDLGHGPFSHLYDSLIKEVPDHIKHEYRSVKILEKLLSECNFWESKEIKDVKTKKPRLTSNNDLCFIQNMITFSEDIKKAPSEDFFIKEKLDELKAYQNRNRKGKLFLFEIVANGLTGIDVDKMDYFARDSHGLGLPNRFDWRRYIQVARVLKVRTHTDCYRLCTPDKEVVNLYELFHTRAVLHQIAYQHKTTRIIEYMIKEALKKANEHVLVYGIPILNCSEPCHMEAFQLLDDSILDIILKGSTSEADLKRIQIMECEDLHQAREWLTRLVERQLPTFIGSTKQSTDPFSLGYVNEENKNRLICEKVVINYGKNNKDPLEQHYFYSKHKPEVPFKTLQNLEMVPELLVPKTFQETKYFWFYDKKDQDLTADKIIKDLREWQRNNRQRARRSSCSF